MEELYADSPVQNLGPTLFWKVKKYKLSNDIVINY